MKCISIILALALSISACEEKDGLTSRGGKPDGRPSQAENLLAAMNSSNLNGFQWMNTPEKFEVSDGSLRVTASEGSDFFNNPEDGKRTATAPLLYREIQGDFVATAQVKPDFSSMWNAAALMVYIDSVNWVKFAFENSDATGKSIVTVVTRGNSDDANGAILDGRDSIWLRMIRKGDTYAMHWSEDGKKYKMARLSSLPYKDAVKIGMEAQSPVGKSAEHEFLLFSLEQKTVNDLRKGE